MPFESFQGIWKKIDVFYKTLLLCILFSKAIKIRRSYII